MTVATKISRNPYTGDGVEDTFAYEFKVFSKTDLRVLVDDVLQTVDVHYTVTPTEANMPAESGGTVVFGGSYIPADGAEIVIQRYLDFYQDLDLTEAGPLSAESLEQTLDKIVMMVQQVGNDLEDVVGEDYVPDYLTHLFITDNVGEEAKNFGLDSVTSVLRVKSAPDDSMDARFFMGSFELLIGTSDTDPLEDTDHKVALFAGARRNNDRTEDIWAFNTLVEAETGVGSYSVIGYELDFNHNDSAYGDCELGESGIVDGLHINSGGEYDPYRALLINGITTQWVKGIEIPHTIVKNVGLIIDAGDGGTVSGAIKATQLVDGEWGINIRRITDSSPTGYLYSATNAAVDAYLFAVQAADPGTSCTPLWLKIQDEPGLFQVKVGVDDSGGTGIRAVYIDNAAA